MEPSSINFARREIEAIDLHILNLLNERFSKITTIGQYKKENGLPIYDQEREEMLINKLKARKVIPDIYVEHLWKEIFFVSRCIQKENNQ